MQTDTISLIPLTQGKFAIVDSVFLSELSKHKWCVQRNKRSHAVTWYAVRHSSKIEGYKTIKMHVVVARMAGLPKSPCYDHKNHNSLDNRVENIRPCTVTQNLANRRKTLAKTSSRYKGVSWNKDDKKWWSIIGYRGKKILLGRFDSELDAAATYQKKAVEIFGEFACC